MRALPEGWEFQYRRVLRSFAKLSERVQGHAEEHDDNLYHFLQDAWHLKDWIKNDPVASAKAPNIEADLEKADAFMVTADLANGTKHLDLKQKIRRGAVVTARKSVINPNPTTPFPPGFFGSEEEEEEWHTFMSTPEHHRIVTLRDGTTTTAEKVAEDVMKAWGRLLRS